MQPEALQLLDIGQPTIQQPGHPQTTVAPFVINVSQPSATAHRHKGIEDFVIEGPSSCSLSLKPSQELSSQQSLESLLEQEAFPESLTVIKKEQSNHDSEDYSRPRMPLEVEPLIERKFHLEQSEVSPQDETNQQEIVDQSCGGRSEGIGRTHTELSKEMLLWQQAGMLTSGGKVGRAVHGDTQETFTDLGSALTTSSSKERETSEHHSPERTLATKFFSEMQSELAHIVTLMQVVLCLHALLL